jgi:hypothetical protein
MRNSQSKQLTLPFELMQQDLSAEYAEMVKQNWKITFSRQYVSSVYARRVMGFIAAQIKEDGEVRDYYQITVDKVIQETGISREDVYRRLKGVVYELSTICYFVESELDGRVVPRHLLDTTRFENPAGYYNGKLTVAFNPQLKGIVKQMSHYTLFELSTYVNFTSWYSMRLYEILYAYRDKQSVTFDIEDYREWMGCGKVLDREGNPRYDKKTGKPKYIKYTKHTDAISRTTNEPLKDFEGTDLEFKVYPIYEQRVGRGRPRIVQIGFDFVKKVMTPSERVALWCRNSEPFRKQYARLKEWKITDENIVKYAKVLGEKGINKLFYHFTEKNKSTKPIAEREKYCNWYINHVGNEMKTKEF